MELALYYASKKLWVFPLAPRGKRPLIPKKRGGNGFHDATLDPEIIKSRAWWGGNPRANIGIATGKSGLTVADLDGPQGQAEWQELAAGRAPRTFTVATGREGGFHLWYDGTSCPSTQEKGRHLDVRGNTGYVLAPGSIHENGTVYRIALNVPRAPVPEWVEPWVRKQKREPAAAQSGNVPDYVKPKTNQSLAARGLANIGYAGYSDREAARLRSALACIEPDIDGKTWYAIGAALHDLNWIVGGIDQGFEMWDEYSARSEGKGAGNGEYKGRDNLATRWRTLQTKEYSGSRFTIASIFAMARERGWDARKDDNLNGHNALAVLPASFSQTNEAIRFPDLNKVGLPTATCRNARVAIRGLGIACEHDLFHDKLRIGGQAIAEWAGDLTDNAVHMLRVVVERTYRFDPGTVNMHDAAVQECLQGAFDPVCDYLGGLTWDRTRRLDTWLVRLLGADDTAFNRAVSRLCLMAAVRRARQPGCKFDQIVVLEGPEGRGKSSALEILAGSENFSDQQILTLDDRGQQEAMCGVWVFELADMAGHARTETERAKSFASRRVDRARPAYGRARVDRPRRCIFFATTNDRTYLKSQTGNRRFWPVWCGRIDLEGLARERDQLWAEACVIEALGESLVLPESLWADASRLQDARRDHDPWDDMLAGDIGKVTDDGRERRINTREIMEGRLQLPAERQNDVMAKRVAYVMRRLGWDGPKPIRDGNVVARGYTRPVTIA